MLDDLEAAAEIDGRVDRLLRAADAYGRFPTPVDDIVAAAKLAHADGYVLDEAAIRLVPPAMQSILRSVKNKLQGLLDRRARVIHISPDIDHQGKRRFVTLHEVTHGILPHQQDLLYVDNQETLSPTTKVLFEREANQGAAELLFQRDRFSRDAADLEISAASIVHLASRYGSSVHAAFRRYAETHPGAVAAIVLDPTPDGVPPMWKRHECMATTAWVARFGAPSWPRAMSEVGYPFLTAIKVPLGEVGLADTRGILTDVRVEAYQTPYRTFVLLWLPQTRRLLPRRLVTIGSWAT